MNNLPRTQPTNAKNDDGGSPVLSGFVVCVGRLFCCRFDCFLTRLDALTPQTSAEITKLRLLNLLGTSSCGDAVFVSDLMDGQTLRLTTFDYHNARFGIEAVAGLCRVSISLVCGASKTASARTVTDENVTVTFDKGGKLTETTTEQTVSDQPRCLHIAAQENRIQLTTPHRHALSTQPPYFFPDGECASGYKDLKYDDFNRPFVIEWSEGGVLVGSANVIVTKFKQIENMVRNYDNETIPEGFVVLDW